MQATGIFFPFFRVIGHVLMTGISVCRAFGAGDGVGRMDGTMGQWNNGIMEQWNNGKGGAALQVTQGVRASSPRRNLNPAKQHKQGVRAFGARQQAAAALSPEDFRPRVQALPWDVTSGPPRAVLWGSYFRLPILIAAIY
jgi:hypothetical protein